MVSAVTVSLPKAISFYYQDRPSGVAMDAGLEEVSSKNWLERGSDLWSSM